MNEHDLQLAVEWARGVVDGASVQSDPSPTTIYMANAARVLLALVERIEKQNAENKAAWDSAEYNARRAEKAEADNARMHSMVHTMTEAENARLRAVVEAAKKARNELGVPQPGYPQPAAKAYEILTTAISALEVKA